MPDEKTEEKQPRRKSRRELSMEKIVRQQADARQVDEQAVAQGYTDEGSAKEEPEKKPEQTFQSESAEEPKEEKEQTEDRSGKHHGPVFLKDDQWMTTIRVDGVDIEVPFSKLQASHQKERASIQRLEEAHLRNAELDQREQLLRQREEALSSRPATQQGVGEQQPPEQGVVDAESLKEKRHALFDAIAVGDYETADDIWREIDAAKRAGHPTASVSELSGEQVEQTVRKVLTEREQQLAARREAARRQSATEYLPTWQEKFADIAEDSELRDIADKKLGQLMAERPNAVMPDLMDEAGDFTRKRKASWINAHSKASMKQREDRKRSLPAADEVATDSKPLGEDEPPPKSREQIIADMRKARHQRAY